MREKDFIYGDSIFRDYRDSRIRDCWDSGIRDYPNFQIYIFTRVLSLHRLLYEWGREKRYRGFKTTLLNNPDAADLFDMVV